MLFVVHAVDKTDMLPTRAKFYRAHRVHLDDAVNYDVDVVTAGTLVADDGETPVGSIFVIDAKDRAAVDAFTRTDPYCVNSVWDKVQIRYKSTVITRSAARRSPVGGRGDGELGRRLHGKVKSAAGQHGRGCARQRAQGRQRGSRPAAENRNQAVPIPGSC
jgi:uncharacterized protein YciI